MAWQDISSAPKDGTLVRLKSEQYAPDDLFWWEDGLWRTTLYGIARKVEAWWDRDCEQPTQWSLPSPEPLPAPPISAERG